MAYSWTRHFPTPSNDDETKCVVCERPIALIRANVSGVKYVHVRAAAETGEAHPLVQAILDQRRDLDAATHATRAARANMSRFIAGMEKAAEICGINVPPRES